jgi:hypothetical protein
LEEDDKASSHAYLPLIPIIRRFARGARAGRLGVGGLWRLEATAEQYLELYRELKDRGAIE